MENTEELKDGIIMPETQINSENQNDAADETESEESDVISFEDLGLDEITLEAIKKKGFVTPSPIQVLAIPRLLNGDSNIIARARTGTGKTAAFGLPIVQNIRSESDHVRAIILEPTRELAMQTCTEMTSFSTGRFPRTAVVYGGASMSEQIRSLRRGVEIVTGTPGRIQDLMERGVLDISKIEYFILDEGDEMLDMGFVDDIENIFSKANPDCRVLLFSATIPAPILKIAQKFMGDYEIVEEEGVVEEPLLIDQKYWVVRDGDKIEALTRLIDYSPDFYGIVFVQKKTDADYVCKALDERGLQVAALHGDIPQNQREKILARFRSGKTRVVVATDVAARGIDIEGLTHVVNYDLPFDGATYVHRIGRTGRAGSSGIAITFVRPEETRRKLGFLRAAVKRSAKGEMTEGQIPSVEEVIEVRRNRLFDDLKTKLGLVQKDSGEETSAEKISDDEELVPLPEGVAAAETPAEKIPHLRKGDPCFDVMAENLCNGQNPQEVVSALLSVVYGSMLSKKRYSKITPVSVRGGRGDRDRFDSDRGGRSRRGAQAGENQIRLYVQMGWHDGYNPKKIADFFSSLLHIHGRDVDAIDMADRFCLLNLPTDAAKRALELSRTDSSIPHMHQDSRNGGDDYESRRGGRGGFGRRDGFRGGRGRDREGDRGFRGSGDRSRNFSHSRPGVHTSTQRNSKAAIFKKGAAKEY
ncbi:DEAD/DEAH box helicase [Treponema sp.]|uniref:DEAD/DEAH box helicase n=1 Tax=Treponema sp. TaxID=166 RepID=UPI00257B70B3|nr:DEAD/DEAH box helicase [Treponema sp.]MBE6354017.1 DEAD/DEAH box helicase [Treponema sp.]